MKEPREMAAKAIILLQNTFRRYKISRGAMLMDLHLPENKCSSHKTLNHSVQAWTHINTKRKKTAQVQCWCTYLSPRESYTHTWYKPYKHLNTISWQKRSSWHWLEWSWSLVRHLWLPQLEPRSQTQRRRYHAYRALTEPLWNRGTCGGRQSHMNSWYTKTRQVGTHWLKSMLSIISLVSSGRLVRKRMWCGGCSGMAAGLVLPPPPIDWEAGMDWPSFALFEKYH